VVKAGAFGIVRVIYDVYGTGQVHELGLGLPLAAIASLTVLYGSLRALQQTDIKRRLAFSTVSQVSHIVLGASLFGPFATIGGLVHLVHQGLMEIGFVTDAQHGIAYGQYAREHTNRGDSHQRDRSRREHAGQEVESNSREAGQLST
jgi:formate hydrogenlyase subunit 3/multisubunit Na+/H+ antiporter MnhD subunit